MASLQNPSYASLGDIAVRCQLLVIDGFNALCELNTESIRGCEVVYYFWRQIYEVSYRLVLAEQGLRKRPFFGMRRMKRDCWAADLLKLIELVPAVA